MTSEHFFAAVGGRNEMGDFVQDLEIGVAAPTPDGQVRIHLLANGRGFIFNASPSVAASLAGRITEALAKTGQLLSPTDKSPSV